MFCDMSGLEYLRYGHQRLYSVIPRNKFLTPPVSTVVLYLTIFLLLSETPREFRAEDDLREITVRSALTYGQRTVRWKGKQLNVVGCVG